MKIALLSPESGAVLSESPASAAADALAAAFSSARHETAVFVPRFKVKLKSKSVKLIKDLEVRTSGRSELVSVEELQRPKGARIILLGNKGAFDRPGVYGEKGVMYGDNAERFILYSLAAIESMKAVLFQPDIVIAVGWGAGLVPAYLKTLYAADGFYYKTSSAFFITDFSETGSFAAQKFKQTGLPWSEFTYDKTEYFGNFSFLKAGAVYADMVFMEHSGLMEKAVTDPEFTKGLNGLYASMLKKLVPLSGPPAEGETSSFSAPAAVKAVIKAFRGRDRA